MVIGSRQRATRRSAQTLHALTSEFSRFDQEGDDIMKEVTLKRIKDAAQREHEKFENMALQVMGQNISLLELSASDWFAFIKNLENRPEFHLNLIIADIPRDVNVNCLKYDSRKKAVPRDIPLADEELHEGCVLMHKVLAPNGTILIYGALNDLP